MVGGTHFNAGGTQAIVLEIEAEESCHLQVSTGDVNLDLPLSDLVVESVGQQIDGFGSPAIKVNRAIPERVFSFTHDETFEPPADTETGFVYARVIQSDGQTAWVSPIWYE